MSVFPASGKKNYETRRAAEVLFKQNLPVPDCAIYAWPQQSKKTLIQQRGRVWSRDFHSRKTLKNRIAAEGAPERYLGTSVQTAFAEGGEYVLNP